MPITHLKRDFDQKACYKYLKLWVNKYIFIYWKYKLQMQQTGKADIAELRDSG